MLLRFCLCICESDTVKSDCPMHIFRKIMKYLKIFYRLLVYFTSCTVCSGDIKKSSEYNMTSVLVIFRAFFFFRPPYHKYEKKSRKSTNKKILPLV